MLHLTTTTHIMLHLTTTTHIMLHLTTTTHIMLHLTTTTHIIYCLSGCKAMDYINLQLHKLLRGFIGITLLYTLWNLLFINKLLFQNLPVGSMWVSRISLPAYMSTWGLYGWYSSGTGDPCWKCEVLMWRTQLHVKLQHNMCWNV